MAQPLDDATVSPAAVSQVARDTATAAGRSLQTPLVSVYDSIPRMREVSRKWIAYALIWLLIITALASLGALIWGQINDDTLKSIATSLIAPVVGLVGAVTGFYFGGGNGTGP